MERKSLGAFIAVLRKSQGMTQRQLAEKLNVSDKTVSRWEREEGYPDLAMIPVLAEIFGVSCDELLRGERISADKQEKTGESGRERTEKQRKHLLSASLNRFKNRSYIAMALAAGGLIAAMGINFGFYRGQLGFFLGLPFFLTAALCQLIFRNNALGTVGELENDESMGRFRLSVLHLTELSLGLDLTLFFATLPLAVFGLANGGITAEYWLCYGSICAAAAAATASVVCYFLNCRLRGKESYATGVKMDRIYRENHRLKARLAFLLAALIVVTGFVHISSTQIWGPGTIMQGVEFDDLESFAEYMEKEAGLPLWQYDSSISQKFYDEMGREISEEEARRRCLVDGNGDVAIEYVQNNDTVCSVQASFQGEKLLSLRVFTYDELEMAKALARQRHGVFAAVYVMELAAVTAVYFKKRAK